VVKSAILSEELTVREVMTSPVVEADLEETVDSIAQKMLRYSISSVVVVSDGEPRGMVTKSDIIEKVVSKNMKPSDVSARETMSTPLHTVEPDTRVDEALRTMNKLKISRLVVVYKGKVAGIISLRDILQVTPEILDIVRENIKIKGAHLPQANEGLQEGYCDSCGEWSDMLVRIDDLLLCEECRLELEEAETRKGE